MTMTRSRRDVLRGAAGLAVALGGVTACKRDPPPFSCREGAGLSPDEAALREALAYAEPALDSTRTCAACQQFMKAGAEGSCGQCKVMKGPIHPSGSCKVFSPKG